MCFGAAPIVCPPPRLWFFSCFPSSPFSSVVKARERQKKREIKERKAAWMLNLGVIFRAVRLWISVLTVSENELFRFRLASPASPLPALTLFLFVHSLSFFPASSSLSTSIFSLAVSTAHSVSSLLPP